MVRKSRVKREQREIHEEIEQLKAKLEGMGGQVNIYNEHDPQATLLFLQEIILFHESPKVVLKDKLGKLGVSLPAPETLGAGQVSDVLRATLEGLAQLNIYLHSTNHLTDQAFYRVLWYQILAEEIHWQEGVSEMIDVAMYVPFEMTGVVVPDPEEPDAKPWGFDRNATLPRPEPTPCS